MQKLIILRGCMASGKSTIAKRYRSFQSKTAWLKVDNFKDFFDHFELEVRSTVHGAANASLNYFLKQGFSVVMDGVFQDPAFIQQAVDVAIKNDVPYKVFELKVALETLQRRDKIRESVEQGCREPLGDEAIALIYNRIKENPYLEAVGLDTEKLCVEEAMEFIDQQFKN